MTKIITYIFTFFLLGPCLTSYAQEIKNMNLYICDDDAEFPPYTYYKRNSKREKTKKIIGFAVDVVKEILEGKNVQLHFTLLPWKRCLKNVKQGNRYQLALNSSYSTQRNREFLFTDYYYEITPKFFYDKARFPNGLSFSTIDELFKKGFVCGLLGYNYEAFAPGIVNLKIDRGAKTFHALAKKLIEGRCRVFLGRYEIIKGFKALGEDYLLGGRIGYGTIPASTTDKFYFLISRKIPYSQKLKKVLDAGIHRLRDKGILDYLLRKNMR